MTKTYDNIVGLRDRTSEEEEQYAKDQKEYQDNIVPRKLAYIKELRLQKLIDTDYLANSDVTMPDNVKTWRQTLRDLPANHTDEAAYDALLARDADGNLTNSVWSKP